MSPRVQILNFAAIQQQPAMQEQQVIQPVIASPIYTFVPAPETGQDEFDELPREIDRNGEFLSEREMMERGIKREKRSIYQKGINAHNE